MEKKSVITRLDKVSSPDGVYLVIYKASGNFKAFNYLMEIIHIFDRQDLFHLYELMMEQYSEITLEGYELILWGDLKIMMESSTEENDQNSALAHSIHSQCFYIVKLYLYKLAITLSRLQRSIQFGTLKGGDENDTQNQDGVEPVKKIQVGCGAQQRKITLEGMKMVVE
ncbi:hypothetical protein Tco_1152129 [Tanacetum coccineum]